MKRVLAAVLMLGLVASAAAASTDSSVPQRGEYLIVQADYIGVSADGRFPDFPNGPQGVTYAVFADGSDATLWASSEDGLDEGVTAMWVGELSSSELVAARQSLLSMGLADGYDGALAASEPIVCALFGLGTLVTIPIMTG